MKYTYLCLFALGTIIACTPSGQLSQNTPSSEESPYLLKVGNEPIQSAEFLYMLSKNRDFESPEDKLSPEEFEENLELFINYKLKVKEAEALGLHESEEFKREFNAFKEDLKKPYLLENSLQEGELRKAYARMQEVVHAKHILLRFPRNASKEDSIAVFRMAQKIKEKAETGENFEELAIAYSQDPSVSTNKGDLGYFTSLQMVYAFEDAVYNLQEGTISDPVLTNFGYHIIKLVDRKPNPGQIKVAHILVRTDAEDPLSADRSRRKIADIYTELQKEGSTWAEVCQAYSEDKDTKNKEGELPWFGIGSFIKDFEQAAFSLNEIGEISRPISTAYGYHIIKLIDTKPIPSYEEMEESLKSKILRDSRSTLIKSQAQAIQKSKYHYQENTENISKTKTLLSDQVYEINTIKSLLEDKGMMDSTLFIIQSEPRKVSDLISFMESSGEVVNIKPRNFFQPWLNKYIETSLTSTEEDDLIANNEEYRLLIKEYRDGILLFDLMNQMVWQKALLDTIGQEAYFKKHQEEYRWAKRADALILRLNQSELISPAEKLLKSKPYSEDLNEYITARFIDASPISYKLQQGTFEYEHHPVLKDVNIQDKNLQKLKYEGKTHLVIIGKTYPEMPKTFNETKGKVIQDYQESLNTDLISLLRNNYIIQINEDEKKKIANIVVAHN
ncbi:peptidylprolyl isomerase [Echinicola marina]|uniref:peptidylprolyl isomerase n=1 Tax=Echinicola marina TaxID=2859768 RepID=UPI001CF608E4|nr:peptidylprolyl isomerase [Echinicola marina]UCS94112.1 peptidylprolyl isomerase [Echinicola marina]